MEVVFAMTLFELITSIALLVGSIVLIVLVLSQQGKDAYLGGAIAGGAAESFLGKNKARTMDQLLTRLTRIVAIVVVLLTLLANVAVFVKG
jgi:preprotein translocase subunit SecG